MRYVLTRYTEYQRDVAYRLYVTDCLRMITENSANAVKGQYMKDRFMNIIYPQPVDSRTGDEIAQDVIKSAGLEVIS